MKGGSCDASLVALTSKREHCHESGFLYCVVYLVNWLSCTYGLSMVHTRAHGAMRGHYEQEVMKHMQLSGCIYAVLDF